MKVGIGLTVGGYVAEDVINTPVVAFTVGCCEEDNFAGLGTGGIVNQVRGYIESTGVDLGTVVGFFGFASFFLWDVSFLVACWSCA